MKLFNQKGIDYIESTWGCSILSDPLQLKVKMFFTSISELQASRKSFVPTGIHAEIEGNYLLISQFDLYNCFSEEQQKEFFSEERVWPSAKGELVPTKEMDHQRLSNCVRLLEVLLEKGKIDKESADKYIERLEDSVVPELAERFEGDVLDYQPYYEWERKLMAE